MKLVLIRHATKGGATIGTLAVDGIPCCFTLEDAVREVAGAPVASWKVAGQTAIPRGTYQIANTYSPHFGRYMPLLIGVPGYEGVRIHPGNTAADTEGCLLVGYVEGENTIGRSRDAFNHLMPMIADAFLHKEEITITIS